MLLTDNSFFEIIKYICITLKPMLQYQILFILYYSIIMKANKKENLYEYMQKNN